MVDNIALKSLLKTKIKAASYHLLISLVVIGLFWAYIRYLLFPGTLYHLETVWDGLEILIPVDVVLGPLMTLALYAPKKKHLVLDLSIIGLCQLLALGYGIASIYRMRPEVLAFAVDRFTVITHKQLEGKTFPWQRFAQQLQHYPQLVYAKKPVANNLAELQRNFFFEKKPENYFPLQDYRHQILAKTFDLNTYHPKNPQARQQKANYLSQPQAWRDQEALFILQGSTELASLIVLDKTTLRIKRYLNIDPWE